MPQTAFVTRGLGRGMALLPSTGLGRVSSTPPPPIPVGDTHDPGWITSDSIKRKRHDGSFEELSPKQIEDTRRQHIEDAFNRLMVIPEAAIKIREVITSEAPDFRILVRNQQVLNLLMELYLEYLDEEDILLMYASTL